MNLLKEKKFLILKYIKLLFKNGKKERTECVLKSAFSFIKNDTKTNPIFILMSCVEKALPFCEIKAIRISGGIQRIPIEIKDNRQKSLALNWLIINTRNRPEITMVERSKKEILETLLLQSQTIKMTDDLHKLVEVNKAFTQFKN